MAMASVPGKRNNLSSSPGLIRYLSPRRIPASQQSARSVPSIVLPYSNYPDGMPWHECIRHSWAVHNAALQLMHGNAQGRWPSPVSAALTTRPSLSVNMALQGALQSLRSGVLSRISIPVNSLQAVGGAGGLTLLRSFAESTYIDKNVVTDRIINVVKNFDKVDPAKVGPPVDN